MNRDLFQKFMQEIDESYLEEAFAAPGQTAVTPETAGKKRMIRLLRWGAAAVCICLVVTCAFFSSVRKDSDGRRISAGDLVSLGFRLILPEEAEAATYEMLDDGDTVKAEFTLKGEEYTCIVSKDAKALPPEGKAGEADWVSWYDEEDQVHYSLFASETQEGSDAEGGISSPALQTTAREIMESLGYDMEVALEGAQKVSYTIFTLDLQDGSEPLHVAETEFTLQGQRYIYRTAAATKTELQDLSGTAGTSYDKQSSAELGWCQAQIFWNEGKNGKILWLDLAPGLVYSLSVDSGASEDMLKEMAEILYTPMQGDVG